MNGVFLFLVTTLQPLLRLNHPSHIYSSAHTLIHPSLTSIESLHYSLQYSTHFTFVLSSHPTGHLCISLFVLIHNPSALLSYYNRNILLDTLVETTTHPLLITLLLHPIRPFLSTITLPSTYTLSTTSLNPFLSLLHFSFYQ